MSAHTSSQAPMSTSPPKLDSSTRSLLDQFLDQKRKEKAFFEHLKSRSSSASTATTSNNNSSSSSSASSITSSRRGKNKKIDPAVRNVLELLPQGRSGKGTKSNKQDVVEDDEDSLIAQAEALADLERLNGIEPSIPISSLRIEESDSDDDSDEDEGQDSGQSEPRQPYQIGVDEFREYFGESWQLSQFWYSSQFSYHLARCLYDLLKTEHSPSVDSGSEKKTVKTAPKESHSRPRTKKIGFICSPTAYVAFRYLYPETTPQPAEMEARMNIESYLFDYDERLSLLAPPQHTLRNPGTSERFVHYDLNSPLAIPPSLEHQLDMVVIDPPYLKAETNHKIAQTVRRLLRSTDDEDGKVLLITGQSIAEQACEIYGTETTDPLRKAENLEVEHVGLKNDFGAWGNWEGVERFGSS